MTSTTRRSLIDVTPPPLPFARWPHTALALDARATMQLNNLTPYSALTYCVVDPQGEEHWAVVARGTYDLVPEEGASNPTATHDVRLAGGELSLKDEYFGEMNQSSVRFESDLAQTKPRCDVIVIGSAWSPSGEAVRRVEVGVRIDRLRDLHSLAPAGHLLAHRLDVYGERFFERSGNGWRLTDPVAFTRLPMRYEHAFGGELKVYEGDRADARIDASRRLSGDGRARHPEGGAAPIAHTSCTHNPVGAGFLERWYADAAEVTRWPAPRIERRDGAITAALFAQLVDGALRPGDTPALAPQGFGVIAKPWSPRLALAGTFDSAWLDSRWPLMPPDFQMAYWNCAHPDMQCAHLFGDELCELVNLLPPDAPGVTRGDDGATVCRFVVPDAGVVAAFADPEATEATVLVPAIDTLILDLDAMTLSAVWRVLVPASRGFDRAALHAFGHPTE